MSGAMFPSTGDPERDAEIAAQWRRSDALLSEGLCPNGCGPLTQLDEYTRTCPACGYIHQRASLGW